MNELEVVIPFFGADPRRLANYGQVVDWWVDRGFRVYTGISHNASRGEARNRGAGLVHGAAMIFCDADIIPDHVDDVMMARNIVQTTQLQKLVYPLRDIYGLNDQRGHRGGLMVINARFFYELGGFPEWSGWGGEDIALWAKAHALGDGVLTLHGSAIHLPHDRENTNVSEGMIKVKEYEAAINDPAKMREIINNELMYV